MLTYMKMHINYERRAITQLSFVPFILFRQRILLWLFLASIFVVVYSRVESAQGKIHACIDVPCESGNT